MKRLQLAVLLAAGSMAASAHHSTSAYDLNKLVSLTGVVREFQWTNPHSWIEVQVSDSSGSLTEWSIECGTPNANVRMGWRKSDLRPGDKISLTARPKRDGTPTGSLVEVTLADGRTLKSPSSSLTTTPPTITGAAP